MGQVERGALQAIIESEQPTLLVVDVGGTRALPDVMELLQTLMACLTARHG